MTADPNIVLVSGTYFLKLLRREYHILTSDQKYSPKFMVLSRPAISSPTLTRLPNDHRPEPASPCTRISTTPADAANRMQPGKAVAFPRSPCKTLHPRSIHLAAPGRDKGRRTRFFRHSSFIRTASDSRRERG